MAQWSDNPGMIGIRSLLFHIASVLVTLVFLPLYPLILAPFRVGWPVLRSYVHAQLWLLRTICGQTYEIEENGNLPDGPCILASRHEALWETLVLPILLDNPAVILKEEIFRYPLAGRIARKLDYIGVDRGGSTERTKATFDAARQAAADGRRVLIFPGGTRNPDHRFRVQGGVVVLYRALKLPCVPIVLNSGDFWPHGSWNRCPGVIRIRVLPAIPPGLRSNDFLAQLTQELAMPA
ncbi:MAG: 1-acyl-sn-glycerol-3-phosphate acyltransferase [Rhodobacter sp.]|nr:1-acyl-sn-glycerol-3-phosphate acyltransferase [Rhodobacter sp.]